MPLDPWQAIAISIISLLAGWVIYEGLCRSPLGNNTVVLATRQSLVLGPEWRCSQAHFVAADHAHIR